MQTVGGEGIEDFEIGRWREQLTPVVRMYYP